METKQDQNFTTETKANLIKKHYPSLGQGFGILGYFILFSIAFGVLSLPKLAYGDNELVDSSINLLVYLATFITIFLMIFRNVNKSEFWATLSFSNQKPILLLLLIPLTLSCAIIIEPLTSWLPMPDVMKETFEKMIKNDALSMIMVVIAAPILEEFIFRGIILKGFLKNYSPTKAIIWSAVLFGLVHMNPWQFIGATILGIVMGWLFWKTNSLIPGIIVHFVNNLSASLIFFYVNDVEGTTRELINNDNIYYLLFFGAITIIILSFFYIKKLYPRTI
jgi:membrane protease YdiL (CAAX protease family)